MDLEQIMQMNTFAVVGDTLNPEKYAYKIKEGLLEQGLQRGQGTPVAQRNPR